MTRTLCLALAGLAAGCAMTHSDGAPDASASPGADGGAAPRPDAAPLACASGLERLDATPEHFDAHDGPLSIATDGARFWIAHRHGNPSPCDGPCLGLRSLPAAGPIDEFRPLYWLYGLDFDPGLEVVSGRGRTLAIGVDRSAAWQSWPVGPEPWRADLTFEPREGEAVVSVAPRLDGGAELLLRASAETPNGVRLTRVVSIGGGGALIDEGAALGIMEVRDARLVPSRIGARWIASIQDWDFPRTVQIDRLDAPEGRSLHGSSCGVDDFDVRELDDARVIVAQRCGPLVQLEVRDASREIATVTDASADVAPAVAVLERGREVVVAYAREGDAAPSLERLRLGDDGRLRTIARVTAPADPRVRLPIAALDVEALEDGTIALAWRGRVPAEDFDASDGAVARFARCD